MWSLDGWVLLASFAGAILFIVQEHEKALWERLVLIPLATYVGYLVSNEIASRYGIETRAVAAFIGAAFTVPLVVRIILVIKEGDITLLFRGRKL